MEILKEQAATSDKIHQTPVSQTQKYTTTK